MSVVRETEGVRVHKKTKIEKIKITLNLNVFLFRKLPKEKLGEFKKCNNFKIGQARQRRGTLVIYILV